MFKVSKKSKIFKVSRNSKITKISEISKSILKSALRCYQHLWCLYLNHIMVKHNVTLNSALYSNNIIDAKVIFWLPSDWSMSIIHPFNPPSSIICLSVWNHSETNLWQNKCFNRCRKWSWTVRVHSTTPPQTDFFWEAWHIKKVKVWKYSKDKSRRVNDPPPDAISPWRSHQSCRSPPANCIKSAET